ncbi:MAG: hypothetical protein KDD62_15410, partial [Bdellovibrionales bacterium]|nr:hypothetical protein [Bdellovibrionales bacterium]
MTEVNMPLPEKQSSSVTVNAFDKCFAVGMVLEAALATGRIHLRKVFDGVPAAEIQVGDYVL